MTREENKIAVEGYGIILLILAAGLVSLLLLPLLSLLFFGLLLFTLYFFRNPKRMPPVGENLIVCPADGTVVAVDTGEEKEFLHQKMQRVAIFMSPFNVHVNRAPISGEITHAVHREGRFKAAFDPRAAELNERSVLCVKTDQGEQIVFMQIAGWFARRIVTYSKVGERVTIGKIFGLIKFGSRMEIFFPEAFVPQVKVGDKVCAGETVLAKK